MMHRPAVLLLLTMLPLTVFAADDATEPDTSTRVTGRFEIAAKDASVDNLVIIVQLWEYDPRLADAGATLIDKAELKVRHEKSKATVAKFVVGAKGKIKPLRNYYVTARGYVDGKQDNSNYLYYGKPSHGGIGRVITAGQPRQVVFHGRRRH